MRNWRPRRAGLGWAFAGVLFMATLGAPLAGAIGAYYWALDVKDLSSDDEIVAQRVVERVVRPSGDLQAMWKAAMREARLEDCWERIARRFPPQRFSPDGEPRPLVGLSVTIQSAWDRKDDATRQNVRANSLMRLPHPVLGALDGCLSASLLAPFCSRYVRQVFNRAEVEWAAEIRNADARSYRLAHAEECTLADLMEGDVKKAQSEQ